MASIGDQFKANVMSRVPDPVAYIDSLGTIAETTWKELARQSTRLNSTEADYVNAIVKHPVVTMGDSMSVTIELTSTDSTRSWLPNMMEQGHSAYSLKDTILGNKDSQVIFMRKGTPEAVNIPRMTQEQYGIASRIKADKPMRVTNPAKAAGRYGVLPTKTYLPKGTENIKKMHKQVLGSSTIYGTFRTISRKSDVEWIHPGFVPLRLAEKTVEQMGF